MQQSQPCLFSSPPSYLYLLPNSDPTMLTLVTSTPLMTFHMSPLAFFDAQSHGLEYISSFPQQSAEKEDTITRLVRTPEGQGVGVLRANGTGEAYTVTKRSTELTQCGKWIATDFAVTLWKGWFDKIPSLRLTSREHRASMGNISTRKRHSDAAHRSHSNPLPARARESFHNAFT